MMRGKIATGLLAMLMLSGGAAAFDCEITPAVQTVTSGQSMTLSATCDNTQPPTAIELLNGDNVVAQVAPSGIITPVNGPFVFVTTASSATQTGAYRIRVTAGGDPVTTPVSYVGVVVPSYAVNANPGLNGSINPASRMVAQGDVASFTVDPADGYLATVTSNCGQTQAGQLNETITYSTNPILAAGCQVNASFTAQPVETDGVCGTATAQTNLTSPPTQNLCSVGPYSSVTTGTSTYSWTCDGINGGQPASCSVTRAVSGGVTDPSSCGAMPANTVKQTLSNFGTSAGVKYNIQPGQTVALRFTAGDAQPNGRLARSASQPTTAVISVCPGKMTTDNSIYCGPGRATPDGSVYYSTTGVSSKCPLVNGVQYYLNINNATTGTVSPTVTHYW